MSTAAIEFCPSCGNMLYHKEDKKKKILLLVCRLCDHQQVAKNWCVYRNVVNHSETERTQELVDPAADPSAPRTKSVLCPLCKHPEARFYQAASSMHRAEAGTGLFYVCCKTECGHRWRDL